MPAVQAPATVLVTGESVKNDDRIHVLIVDLCLGANGYIAIWIIKYLLERGFTVRGTVRSASKGDYVKNLVGKGFEYAVVPDVNAVSLSYIVTTGLADKAPA